MASDERDLSPEEEAGIENPGDPPQLFPEFLELDHRFLVDQRLPALGDRVPQIGAVLGHASCKAVCLAVIPHFSGRPRRVQGDGTSAGC